MTQVEAERSNWQDQCTHFDTLAKDREKELERLRVQYEALRSQVGLASFQKSPADPVRTDLRLCLIASLTRMHRHDRRPSPSVVMAIAAPLFSKNN
jgi:hypothetical protein